MKRFYVFVFLFVFGFLLFSEMPKSFTSIHRLDGSFKNFSSDNPQYKLKDGFLIRKKPNYTGKSWNYNLIVIGKNDKNLIDSMLFQVYNNTSKKHISNKKELRKLLSNQFKESKYSIIKTKNIDEIIETNLNGDIFKFIDNKFNQKDAKVELICSDYKNLIVFFIYKNNYYIYLSSFKKSEKKLEKKDETAVEKKESPVVEEKKDETAVEKKESPVVEEKKDETAVEKKESPVVEEKKDETVVEKKESPVVEEKKEEPSVDNNGEPVRVLEEKKEISKDVTSD